MNEFSENATYAAFCPKCSEKNPTNFIEPDPQISVVCSSCGANYFPFRESVEKHEPSNLDY